LRGLSDLTANAGDYKEYNHGEEGGKDGGKRVLSTTVLGDLDDLGDGPTNKVHPRHSRGEREATNNRVESLGLEFLGDEVYGLESSGRHCVCYTVLQENYSSLTSSFLTIFLNFLVLIDFVFENNASSSDESSLELESKLEMCNLLLFSENVQPSGSEMLITINSIF
jgi:hypothetical protein